MGEQMNTLHEHFKNSEFLRSTRFKLFNQTKENAIYYCDLLKFTISRAPQKEISYGTASDNIA